MVQAFFEKLDFETCELKGKARTRPEILRVVLCFGSTMLPM